MLLQRPNRQVPMTEFVDTRVDICLYFIAPHALLPADIATMQRLGRTVPIVPIISKVQHSFPLEHAQRARHTASVWQSCLSGL